MKKFIVPILLLLVCLFAYVSQAQNDEKKELPVTLERRENKQVYFEKVYMVETASKADLYQRVKEWVTTNLSSSDNNISFDDQDKDYINTTARMPLEGLSGISVSFKVSIHFKDGKVKLECPSFTYISMTEGRLVESELGNIKFGGANKRIYRSFDKTFEKFLQSFDNGIHYSQKKSDNW